MKPIVLFILITFFCSSYGVRSKEEVREIIRNMLECEAKWRYYAHLGVQDILEEIVYFESPKSKDDTCPRSCILAIDHDGYLSCEECAGIWRKEENCQVHGKLTVIEDRPVVKEDPLMALHTLPYGFFVSKSTIPQAGLGVFTSIDIPAMVRLGPYGGSIHEDTFDHPDALLYSWQVEHEDGTLTLVNALNVSYSNYLRYVNMPNCKDDSNTFAVQYELDIYYVTLHRVPAVCFQCDKFYHGQCPVHGPLKVIYDNKPQNENCLRAMETAPKGIKIAKSSIEGAGLGAWTRVFLPVGIRFGPYQGRFQYSLKNDDWKYSWGIYQEDRIVFINATDPSLSNWLRYINMPNHKKDANLKAMQYQGQLYYVTIMDIPMGSELLIWYGNKYARLLGILEVDAAS